MLNKSYSMKNSIWILAEHNTVHSETIWEYIRYRHNAHHWYRWNIIYSANDATQSFLYPIIFTNFCCLSTHGIFILAFGIPTDPMCFVFFLISFQIPIFFFDLFYEYILKWSIIEVIVYS